eukprot:6944005-Pyramimonas_sp.AAC.1
MPVNSFLVRAKQGGPRGPGFDVGDRVQGEVVGGGSDVGTALPSALGSLIGAKPGFDHGAEAVGYGCSVQSS